MSNPAETLFLLTSLSHIADRHIFFRSVPQVIDMMTWEVPKDVTHFVFKGIKGSDNSKIQSA